VLMTAATLTAAARKRNHVQKCSTQRFASCP